MASVSMTAVRSYRSDHPVRSVDTPEGSGAELREEINTPPGLDIVARPLDGSGFGFRRFLFFAGGHKRLMKDVESNLRALLTTN